MKPEPFKLERFFAAHEFSARKLLSCSDAETMRLRDLLDYEPDFYETLLEQRLGYSESAGIPELRTAIAESYAAIKPHDVLLHTGAQEPIFALMQTMLSPGDHVIVHFPCYQSYYSLPRAIGCSVDFWHARFENHWQLDLDELKRLLKPNTKLVITNFPHNPTGALGSPADQRALISLLRERGILLLSDEVYRGLELDPADRLPAACDLYERAVSLGVLSKAYGLAGLRVGWVATQDRTVIDAMAGFKDYTTICNPVLTERLALIAVKHREAIWERNRQIVQKNLALLDDFFDRHAARVEWHRPPGGTVAFPRVRPGIDLDVIAQGLLAERKTMLVTGRQFDYADRASGGDRYFRLGFGRAGFADALAELDDAL